jgi:hypothetical protein
MSRDVSPPWIAYRNVDPWWGGWRQGVSESWLNGTWLPFWRRLTRGEREAYLERWPPPDEDWRVYLLEYWTKEVPKSS